MKKRDFSDRERYESPAVTLLDVRVEQGFGASFDVSTDSEDGSGSESLAEEDW